MLNLEYNSATYPIIHKKILKYLDNTILYLVTYYITQYSNSNLIEFKISIVNIEVKDVGLTWLGDMVGKSQVPTQAFKLRIQ